MRGCQDRHTRADKLSSGIKDFPCKPQILPRSVGDERGAGQEPESQHFDETLGRGWACVADNCSITSVHCTTTVSAALAAIEKVEPSIAKGKATPALRRNLRMVTLISSCKVMP